MLIHERNVHELWQRLYPALYVFDLSVLYTEILLALSTLLCILRIKVTSSKLYIGSYPSAAFKLQGSLCHDIQHH